MRLFAYRVKKIFGLTKIRVPAMSRTNNLYIEQVNQRFMELCGQYDDKKDPLIVGEFVIKSGKALRYVSHLVNADKHNEFVRRKKNRPALYYISRPFMSRRKIAIVTLVWGEGIMESPDLQFDSHVYMNGNDQKIREELKLLIFKLKTFSLHTKVCEEVSQ